MEVDSISQQPPEKVEQIETADLVVGILAALDTDGIDSLLQAFRGLSGSPRIVVLQSGIASTPMPSESEAAEQPALSLVPWASVGSGASAESPAQSISSAYQSAFAFSEKVGARACCVIASTLEVPGSQWIAQVVRPLLEDNFDFVAAHYARHKFEGMLNASIIYPVMRSLYGKRLHNPMGPDLGISRQLFQKVLAANGHAKSKGGPTYPLTSLAPMALCGNLKIAQVNVPPRVYPPTDRSNVSSLLAQILGPVFLDVEKNAVYWQRIRGSASIAEFEDPSIVSGDPGGAIDVNRLLDSFQLGYRDLQEIWRAVLPPTTLFELAKVSRLAPEQFRMQDELWVRIVYDFALAHRLRTINRDHLLRSLTPLYLGWVASYTLEAESATAEAMEERLEHLAAAYEAGKPYLVSRWRWPDRFNP